MIYEKIIRPILFKFSERDPEIAHEKTLSLLRWIGQREWLVKLIENFLTVKDERLEQEVFGLNFPNPVGLAAGFDKNAVALQGLQALGFGFLEVGTVTKYRQTGNVRPRISRFKKEEALINRMGFPNDGADIIAKRLRKTKKVTIPLGINLGKSTNTPLEYATEDYKYLLRKFYNEGDYFVINISSPNIPGLRELQEKKKLDVLLRSVRKEAKILAKHSQGVRKPILLKISPDLEPKAIDDLLDICCERRVDGLIATNTTISRDGLNASAPKEGGMSGRPLFSKTIKTVRYIHQQTKGKLSIIGAGGIFSPEQAYEMLQAGASLIQVYTGFIYRGPALPRRINKGLRSLMDQDGIKHISELKYQKEQGKTLAVRAWLRK